MCKRSYIPPALPARGSRSSPNRQSARGAEGTGDRKGVWGLHVTRNWRMTFRIEEGEIVDLNLEDYH